MSNGLRRTSDRLSAESVGNGRVRRKSVGVHWTSSGSVKYCHPPPSPTGHNHHHNCPHTTTSHNVCTMQYFTLPWLFHVESMEGAMDCRNSRWIPWNGGWIPWNGGWIPYFFQMDSILFPAGFHTISIWIPAGISSWNHQSTLMPRSSNLNGD